jgi:hypothetical protein
MGIFQFFDVYVHTHDQTDFFTCALSINCCPRKKCTWVRAYISRYFEFSLTFLVEYSTANIWINSSFVLVKFQLEEKNKYLHMRTIIFISFLKKAGLPEWHRTLHTLPVGLKTGEGPGINWNANLTFESKTRLPSSPPTWRKRMWVEPVYHTGRHWTRFGVAFSESL